MLFPASRSTSNAAGFVLPPSRLLSVRKDLNHPSSLVSSTRSCFSLVLSSELLQDTLEERSPLRQESRPPRPTHGLPPHRKCSHRRPQHQASCIVLLSSPPDFAFPGKPTPSSPLFSNTVPPSACISSFLFPTGLTLSTGSLHAQDGTLGVLKAKECLPTDVVLRFIRIFSTAAASKSFSFHHRRFLPHTRTFSFPPCDKNPPAGG